MKHLRIALLLCAVGLVIPGLVHAETVLRVSDSVSVAVDQVVNGDFYGFAGFAGPVSISGTVKGDALMIGSSVTANGSIEADLFAVGGSAQMHASVTDDVRVIAGDITIAEHVGGDVFVLGGVLTVLSSATIEGNIFFYGGKGEINGRVGGSIYGTSEQLRVDGPVAGGVDVTVARSLVIGDRADIGADIRYESPNDIVRAPNAVVVGDIVKNTARNEVANPRTALIPFLIYAFTALIIYALFRTRVQSLTQQALHEFTKNGLIGVAGMFALPFVVSFLFVTVIGAVVGLLGLFALIFLYLLSFILASALIGLLMERSIKHTNTLSIVWMVVGIITTTGVLMIPIVGPVVLIVSMSVVLGTLLLRLYRGLF